MNKNDIIRTVELVKENFTLAHAATPVVVTAGGAMVMHGLREESYDLDLEVEQAMYDYWLNGPNKGVSDALLGGKIVTITDGVDIHMASAEATTVEIEGVTTFDLPSLLTQKLALVTHPRRKRLKVVQDMLDLAAIVSAGSSMYAGTPSWDSAVVRYNALLA